jgi:hypothetical protein
LFPTLGVEKNVALPRLELRQRWATDVIEKGERKGEKQILRCAQDDPIKMRSGWW